MFRDHKNSQIQTHVGDRISLYVLQQGSQTLALTKAHVVKEHRPQRSLHDRELGLPCSLRMSPTKAVVPADLQGH